MPVFHLLAGSNGAGKSTYADDVLIPVTGLPFINADVIAAQTWADPEPHAYEAAQFAEALRRQSLNLGQSFISETVFSHESKVALVSDASALGYIVNLHVVIVPVGLTVRRVHDRVRLGGHRVDEDKIRGRYERLWDYVAQAIRIADVTEVLDNSNAEEPFRVCAAFTKGVVTGPVEWPTWAPSPLVALTT
ncbi:zeta toxin family protein [Nocardioides plantarum]|uniref:UDP-N-acetylglucosamine kinase n=1 Tax=Nocardioides plantarum TaxID=29299 RepID=A0ABV5KFP2_9ACTN|nr:zeta toxin family protein [Nocardioides plantarum]